MLNIFMSQPRHDSRKKQADTSRFHHIFEMVTEEYLLQDQDFFVIDVGAETRILGFRIWKSAQSMNKANIVTTALKPETKKKAFIVLCELLLPTCYIRLGGMERYFSFCSSKAKV